MQSAFYTDCLGRGELCIDPGVPTPGIVMIFSDEEVDVLIERYLAGDGRITASSATYYKMSEHSLVQARIEVVTDNNHRWILEGEAIWPEEQFRRYIDLQTTSELSWIMVAYPKKEGMATILAKTGHCTELQERPQSRVLAI